MGSWGVSRGTEAVAANSTTAIMVCTVSSSAFGEEVEHGGGEGAPPLSLSLRKDIRIALMILRYSLRPSLGEGVRASLRSAGRPRPRPRPAAEGGEVAHHNR